MARGQSTGFQQSLDTSAGTGPVAPAPVTNAGPQGGDATNLLHMIFPPTEHNIFTPTGVTLNPPITSPMSNPGGVNLKPPITSPMFNPGGTAPQTPAAPGAPRPGKPGQNGGPFNPFFKVGGMVRG